jgi:hypothetical protein
MSYWESLESRKLVSKHIHLIEEENTIRHCKSCYPLLHKECNICFYTFRFRQSTLVNSHILPIFKMSRCDKQDTVFIASTHLELEQRLRVFENRVLRRIFGPKRDEVKEGWKKLHDEELRDLYSSPSITGMIKSRRMRWADHVARMWEKRNEYRLLVEIIGGKARGKVAAKKTKK